MNFFYKLYKAVKTMPNTDYGNIYTNMAWNGDTLDWRTGKLKSKQSNTVILCNNK